MTAPIVNTPVVKSARDLVVEPGWTSPLTLIREVERAWPLVMALARKSFFVQYRRTAFGLFWAVGLPVVQALILAFVFSRVARFDVPHYAVYVISGMVPWTYFTSTLLVGATSVVDNSALASKIYFPRAVLPLSMAMTNAYGLGIGSFVTVAFAACYRAGPGWHTLLIIPAVLLLIVLVASFVLALSVAHVYLRDTRYFVTAATLGWLWVTPVVYPLSQAHGVLRTVIEINPMSGIVETFHAAVYTTPLDGSLLLTTVAWAVALATIALALHARFDRVLVDLL